jgi:hypothetical protein
MKFRCAETQFVTLLLTTILWISPAMAQSKQSSAAASSSTQASSKVSTEMVKGKLNPATSKPGDKVVVRTKDDLKSNGQVVLKKGTEITGVVKDVKRADGKAEGKGQVQSMMQVDWLTPAGSGASAQQLNFALQSIAYTNPLYAHQQSDESSSGGGVARPAAPARTGSGGGLGGVAGGVVGGATSGLSAAGTITSGVGGAVAGTTNAAGNTSLLAAPSPVAPSSATATTLQNSFGVSSNSLFMVGHGSAVSTGGTANSMDIFTHMSNDAVITSPSKDFEVASGAQMDFMVSARGQK